MIQGLSLGGEYGSSATYLSEVAGKERRGFWSSFQYVTLIAGQLVALALLLLLQTILPEAALEAWGWRIAFLAGALLAVVVFFIRRRLSESPGFEAAVKSLRNRPCRGSIRRLSLTSRLSRGWLRGLSWATQRATTSTINRWPS
jgi:MFS family permease